MQRLGLILLYFLVLAALFARSIPLFEASDEAEHFIYIHQILETGALPVIQSREAMANQNEPILRWNNQSHHAPLYYLMAAALVSWTERADLADYLAPNELIFLRNTVEDNPNKWLHRYTEPTSDSHIAVYFLRGVNILIGMGTLCMVYYAAKQLNEGEGLALLSTFFVASLPTFIVVNASVSNDGLVIFLYSAGIAWILRIWRLQEIRRWDILLISLVLAGSSLTKLTGVSLFGLIFFGLLLAAWRGRISWRRAIVTMISSLLVTALLAGWWYFRNYQVYGDPLALEATASIWGREIPFTLEMLPAELLRIGKSFWMMVGYLHFPVFASDWFYWLMLGLTIGGLVGLAIYSARKPRFEIGLLLFACLLVIGMLLYGTRSVDISYGRLLLPAIAAFAPMLMLGWQTILRRFAPLVLLPMVFMVFYVPLLLLPQAYPSLTIAQGFPINAIPVNWTSENLEIVAIAFPEASLQPGQTMTVDLYFRGSHPDNPALIITAVDSIRTARLDHMEIYPAMADMRYLPNEAVYHLPIRMELGEPDAALPPRMVYLNLEWVNLEDDNPIVFDSGLSRLEIPAAAFSDPAYTAPNLRPIEASFSEIALESYSIESGTLQFVWKPLQVSEDWTLTIQLFDSAGEFVTQEDGALWWYPTSRWIEALTFEDVRSLPANLDTGEYVIRLGWYREESGEFIRMPVTEGESQDNLLILPERLIID